MSLTIVSDWHLGATRSAGVTPATAYQLRQDLLANGEAILEQINGDLLVNGDLFDGPDIPRADLLAAVRMFSAWVQNAGSGDLFLANGNHDLDKNSSRLSSFQFFAKLLVELHPGGVVHIEEGTFLDQHDAYVIPHVANSDLLNLELTKVPTCTYLFVHANYDNGFAVEMDHSLNVSQEQAKAAPVKHVIFGHEHQQKKALAGKVVLVGNNFPSSVSDCLGNDTKRLVRVDGGAPEFIETWRAADDFLEADWRDLSDLVDARQRFIRVTGTATAAEAGAVPTAIARFRRDAKALVITNAVKIEGVDDAAQLALSHEEVTSFNVRAALEEYMGPADWARIVELEKEAAPEAEKEAA